MSVADDVRQAFQDVLAPDLDAVGRGLASAERGAKLRHEVILAELRAAQAIAEFRHEAILMALDIDKRLNAGE